MAAIPPQLTAPHSPQLDTTTEGVEQLAIYHEVLAAADLEAIKWLRRRDLDAERLTLAAERSTLTAETLRAVTRERDAANDRAERAESERERLLDAEAELHAKLELAEGDITAMRATLAEVTGILGRLATEVPELPPPLAQDVPTALSRARRALGIAA